MGQHRIIKPSPPSQLPPGQHMGQRAMTMDYGHNGKQVVVIFPARVANLFLTPEQVDGMIDALKIAKETLVNYQATEAQNGGPGHG